MKTLLTSVGTSDNCDVFLTEIISYQENEMMAFKTEGHGLPFPGLLALAKLRRCTSCVKPMHCYLALMWFKGPWNMTGQGKSFCFAANKVNELDRVPLCKVRWWGGDVTPASTNKKMTPRIKSYLGSSRFWAISTEIHALRTRY
jgi:hypothetical protein